MTGSLLTAVKFKFSLALSSFFVCSPQKKKKKKKKKKHTHTTAAIWKKKCSCHRAVSFVKAVTTFDASSKLIPFESN